MPRVVSLFLPTWSTDRRRRKGGGPPPEIPFVMVGRDARRRVVTAVDVAAARLGARRGMPSTKVQALIPGLVVEDADPEADRAALERLAIWALHYSPIVSADGTDGLVIETNGVDHLFGGEGAMLAEICGRLRKAGIQRRVGMADTWGAAHALARFAGNEISVAPPDTAAAAIAKLPIAALRLDPDVVDGLRKLGFGQISDVAATPRAPLTLRFGPQVCRRLDQAHGVLSEPIEPIRPAEIVEVRQIFAEPIGAPETLHRYTARLVTVLCAALEERGLGARRLDLLFHRVDNCIEAIRVGTSTPTREIKRLVRLLGDRIETVAPGFGIELMRLAATLAEPMGERQTISSLVEEPEADVSDLIDVLANRVGENRVYRVMSIASDVPERAVNRVSAASTIVETDWPTRWPRPPRLLKPPEPIEALAALPDHPPVVFTWRGIRRRVKRADGPERVFGEWWKADAELVAVRDYFQVEDEAGERFWIYRSGDGEHAETGSHGWFIHGIFG